MCRSQEQGEIKKKKLRKRFSVKVLASTPRYTSVRDAPTLLRASPTGLTASVAEKKIARGKEQAQTAH
jgi:hypothetical protein